MKDRMCFSRFSWDTWRFVPSNILRISASIQLLCILGLLVVSIFLKADYGWRGYIFLLIMYYMRNDKPGQAILGSCWLYYEWRACFRLSVH